MERHGLFTEQVTMGVSCALYLSCVASQLFLADVFQFCQLVWTALSVKMPTDHGDNAQIFRPCLFVAFRGTSPFA
jgi:hypothetical protein